MITDDKAEGGNRRLSEYEKDQQLGKVRKNLVKELSSDNLYRVFFYAALCYLCLTVIKFFNYDLDSRISVNLISKYKTNVLDIEPLFHMSTLEVSALRVFAYGMNAFLVLSRILFYVASRG